MAPPVEYAMKLRIATLNSKELFAECFAFYMVKKKLPEPIVKLLERSISYAKANRDKTKDE